MKNAANNLGNQNGYTIATVLILLTILALLGTMATRNTNTDLVLSKRTQRNVRAAFVAESAVNWALSEVRRPRGDYVPYTKATHDPTGDDTLKYVDGSETQGRKLRVSEVYGVYGTSVTVNSNGWITTQTSTVSSTFSGVTPEILAFKVWYPPSPVNSIRISAIGVAGTDTSQVEFIGTFTNGFIAN